MDSVEARLVAFRDEVVAALKESQDPALQTRVLLMELSAEVTEEAHDTAQTKDLGFRDIAVRSDAYWDDVYEATEPSKLIPREQSGYQVRKGRPPPQVQAQLPYGHDQNSSGPRSAPGSLGTNDKVPELEY